MVSLGHLRSYSMSICLLLITAVFSVSLYFAIFYPENLNGVLLLGVLISGLLGIIIATYDILEYTSQLRLEGTDFELGDDALGVVWDRAELEFDLELLHMLTGVKETEDDFIDVSTPSNDLHKFHDLLHPVRLSAMKLLYLFDKLYCTTIKDHLEIPWHQSEPHLKALKKAGYIRTVDHLLNPINQSVYITPKGREVYKDLFDTLQKFIASHFNYMDTGENAPEDHHLDGLHN